MSRQLNIEEKFNSEFQKVLNNIMISFVPDNVWYERTLLALAFASPISLGISGTTFLELLDAHGKKELSCYNFAILSNNLEARSARDLGLVLDEYVRFMSKCAEHTDEWNKQTENLRETLMQKLLGEEFQKNNKPGLKVTN